MSRHIRNVGCISHFTMKGWTQSLGCQRWIWVELRASSFLPHTRTRWESLLWLWTSILKPYEWWALTGRWCDWCCLDAVLVYTGVGMEGRRIDNKSLERRHLDIFFSFQDLYPKAHTVDVHALGSWKPRAPSNLRKQRHDAPHLAWVSGLPRHCTLAAILNLLALRPKLKHGNPLSTMRRSYMQGSALGLLSNMKLYTSIT